MGERTSGSAPPGVIAGTGGGRGSIIGVVIAPGGGQGFLVDVVYDIFFSDADRPKPILAEGADGCS